MILVDKEVKSRVTKGELIVEGYSEKNVKGIAYELTIDCVYDAENKAVSSYNIEPGDFVYVKTIEKLSIPYDITARIIERNSVMRLGLEVSGPQYIPGHRTFCFLRVHNISKSVITLEKGFGIAQVMFNRLSDVPEQTYDKQENSSFQDETEYTGIARYQKAYEQLKKNF